MNVIVCLCEINVIYCYFNQSRTFIGINTVIKNIQYLNLSFMLLYTAVNYATAVLASEQQGTTNVC